MSNFQMSRSELGRVKDTVEKAVGQNVATYQAFSNQPYCGFCGCGAGGTCASSCVSGCAERGGCGPYGPK